MKTLDEQKKLLKIVFSPTAPIKEESFFRGRIVQLKRIVDVMNEEGQHAILYGERGVGKTSMANITQKHITNLYSVKITCNSNDDFKSLWKRALEEMQFSKTIKGIGFKPEEKSNMHTLGDTINNSDEIHPHQILTILKQFPRAKFLFIFDEFDNIKKQQTRVQFADLIKTLSDNSDNIKIMIVGIADNVMNLIGNHKSLERCLMQIRMPRMSEDELSEIITKGCEELEVEMTKQVRNKIIKFSSGFPHYTHLLCKYAIKNALNRNSTRVSTSDLIIAINQAIDNASEQLRSSYRSAIHTTDLNSKWQDMIYACSTCYSDQFDSFTITDVQSRLRQLIHMDLTSDFVRDYLEMLCQEDRGLMLEKFGAGNDIRYRFYNPMMKPFVLLNIESSS